MGLGYFGVLSPLLFLQKENLMALIPNSDPTRKEEVKSEAGLPDGYFDERRAQIRLEILKGCHGNSGTEIVKNAKVIEAWVLGE